MKIIFKFYPIPILVVVAVMWGGSGQAQEFKGTRSVALSNALRGAISLNEGIYHNPASIAFARRYSIEAATSVMPSHDEVKTIWITGVSVVDSHSQPVQGGFGYYNKSQSVEHGGQLRDLDENVFHLAVATSVVERVSLGLTGKYIHQDKPTGDRQFFNVDLGTFWAVSSGLHLGVVGHNILKQDDEFPRELGAGVRFSAWEFLFVNVDILKLLDGPFTENVSLHTGFEVVHRLRNLVFQGGLSLSDQEERNQFSFGAGWSQHKVGLFYAFQNSMDGLARRTHSLSFRVFF